MDWSSEGLGGVIFLGLVLVLWLALFLFGR